MRILVAMDKFKGSLSAAEAGGAVVRGLRAVFPQAEFDLCPIADGGEGTADAVVAALGGSWVSVRAHDAIGREIEARYGIVTRDGRKEAVMEMSAASGLALVSDQPLNPRIASTFGTGEMMLDALRREAGRITIGIGGSATNDGGIGMAAALGFQFLDADGGPVSSLPGDFESVRSIRRPAQPMREVLTACDVRNPLLGPQGATAVYGPQKGVRDIAFFESRLERLAEIIRLDLGTDFRDVPGAGAAGGLGFGLMSFCGARLLPGFELVADVTGLRSRMERADLVVTGEGRLDGQTLHGKGPDGVAEMARSLGKKTAGIAGVIEPSEALGSRFELLLQCKPEAMPVAEAMRCGARLLEEKVVASADALRAWASRG